ncbi:type I CRISPR-associated protein Cas7 [Methanocalculus taiwanensis]
MGWLLVIGIESSALRPKFSSSARPEGSMEVCKVFWWKHNSRSGQYSSAKVHRTLHVQPKTDTPKSVEDYEITVDPLEGLEPVIFDGM